MDDQVDLAAGATPDGVGSDGDAAAGLQVGGWHWTAAAVEGAGWELSAKSFLID